MILHRYRHIDFYECLSVTNIISFEIKCNYLVLLSVLGLTDEEVSIVRSEA